MYVGILVYNGLQVLHAGVCKSENNKNLVLNSSMIADLICDPGS